MKTFITDDFFWDVYNFLDKAGDLLIRPVPTMRNTLPGPRNPIFKKYQKRIGRKKFSKLIYYLKVRGYIETKNLKSNDAIIITKDGIDRAIKSSFRLDRKRRKDGKWTMLIFDVPEKQRKSRDILRGTLNSLGYKMFQQSVWISPYDVQEKTERFLQWRSLEKYVKIFLIEEI